ncbi:COP9 signalosome complex subunit 7b isoform X2 [Harmonia axyridis]|uniref:COP9 signalosome complex subunit 7b isoform X2 n=1 Tax=Harmonia axyridis TaxID=115357 RepID=UPI001E2766DB|nr:COP9 signalosome complex subunit 7b isoform X2 [Harmonia axyridis]
MIDKGSHSNNPLEQFVLLAKSAKGAACNELIKQVLESPGVYVFGELLDMPNITELKNGPEVKVYNTLNLFAYGTYSHYLANPSDYLELTSLQRKKLQHLSLVTLATKSKCLPYDVLLKELDMTNVRDLEDLIIEGIYADIIHGKLDQKNSQFEVDFAIGRDIQAGDINVIVNCLRDWCNACEGVLSCVETQIQRANEEKNKNIQRKSDIEQEIVNIKKTLKTQLSDRPDGVDDSMSSDNRDATATDKGKKTMKIKGLKILR